MKPIALTIGKDDEGRIIARADKAASFEILDFVRIGNVIGRIVKIEDSHDFPRDSEISLIAKRCLEEEKLPGEEVEGMLYKRLVIEPLGVALPSGELSEYQGGIGFFQQVFLARDSDIAKLYPQKDGIPIGRIASGWKVSGVGFRLGETALSRHMAIFGKNGTGKTNLIKEIIAANLERENPVPILAFGHPDLGLDNPSDRGTRGLLSLKDERIVPVGYKERIKLSPEELELDDIFEQFEVSAAMRDLWSHMKAREPRRFVEILADYDVNEDPLGLRRKTVKDRATGETRTVGIAHPATLDAVSRQARILARYVDSDAPPLVSRIIANLRRGSTVLVNTFNMSEYYQGLFVKLVLGRLKRAGKSAMHRKVAQRILVVIDEAQHFVGVAGEDVAGFIRECRKFGVTLLLSTQSPRSLPESVLGQIYSVISFHLNRPDLRALVESAPMLEDLRYMVAYPPLKETLGLAIVQAVGYPYPAVVKVPRFERRLVL